ncbi:uncharacterized protein BJX67DRAFT_373754 [Aspergillus lucknowensis]|uniref:Zn(2)-C6 fungal-type domain-containing protein n=1 Tax=Aspergillus lucknowensis TaxID=176173 RepID=A0ABR4LJC7_9EURO
MATRKGTPSRKRPLRLPPIAPKNDMTPTSSVGGAPLAGRATILQSRLRFPPRSRTGFKCDEVHPQCNQCARLGHVCDYQPRLCFRDDTRRVMERMPDVKTKGNAVWDSKVLRQGENLSNSDSVPCDFLPAFSMLTSDEDREKKAQGSAPGTYHVVVVPESFSRLPEYTEDALEGVPSNPFLSPGSDYSSYDPMGEVTASEDPNVVIVNRFRDPRKQADLSRRSYTQSPESDLGPNSVSAALMYTALQDISEDQVPENVHVETFDMALFDNFQNVVLMQLIPETHGYLEANVFEQEASNFPPLLHIMMALSALSLVRQGNSHFLDALQYYDQAMPSLQASLQNCEDVLSDGLFLTHFLLLIYQITFAKPSHGSSLWSHHMSRLLQLSLLRQSVAGRERYPLVIWLVSHVDLYALFSGAGAGEYVKAAVTNHLLPEAELLFHPTGSESPAMLYTGEYDVLLLIMRLHRESFLLAVRLGLFAAEVRRSKLPHVEQVYQELENLRGAFRRLWTSHDIRSLAEGQPNLPKRSRHSFQQLSLLFHTSLLLSYTDHSLQNGLRYEREVRHHTEAILQIAEGMIPEAYHNGPLLLAFPLFLSGAAALSSELKATAAELLASLAETELGYDAATTGSMLHIVCKIQAQRLSSGGYLQDIDWSKVMANHGFQLVNYG